MADFLIYETSTKSIVYRYSSPTQLKFGGPWSNSSVYTHTEITNGVSLDVATVDVSDNIIEDLSLAWTILREKRDNLLFKSDWTQVADAPLTAQQVTDWVTYRQELRDLPANTVDPKSPTWPTEPT